MTGGKSSQSSSTTSTSTQETVTPDISGVVTGDAIQGQNVNITGLTSGDISTAISGLINLVGTSVGAVVHTVDEASKIGGQAIEAQRTTTTSVVAPTQSTLEKLIPLLGIGAALVTILAYFKKGK